MRIFSDKQTGISLESWCLSKLRIVRFLTFVVIKFSTQSNINKTKHNISGPCNWLFSFFILKKHLCFKIWEWIHILSNTQLKLSEKPNCSLHECLTTSKQSIEQLKPFLEILALCLFRKLWTWQKSYYQTIASMSF